MGDKERMVEELEDLGAECIITEKGFSCIAKDEVTRDKMNNKLKSEGHKIYDKESRQYL